MLADLEDDIELKCILCDYSHSWTGHLNIHLIKHSGKVNLVNFNVSHVPFIQSSWPFKESIIYQHTMEQNKNIQICAFSFSRAGHLNNHKSTHSGQKHYDASDVKYHSVDAFEFAFEDRKSQILKSESVNVSNVTIHSI